MIFARRLERATVAEVVAPANRSGNKEKEVELNLEFQMLMHWLCVAGIQAGALPRQDAEQSGRMPAAGERRKSAPHMKGVPR